jgi:hypothetical protein
MNQFAQLIKTLNREVTELKTVKRLATTTLETATKSINARGVITCANASGGGRTIFTGKAAFIGISTPDYAPFSVTLSNEEQRLYRIFGASRNDQPGIIVAPTYTRSRDVNMGLGDKTVSFTVNVTSSDEVTLTFELVDFEEAS